MMNCVVSYHNARWWKIHFHVKKSVSCMVKMIYIYIRRSVCSNICMNSEYVNSSTTSIYLVQNAQYKYVVYNTCESLIVTAWHSSYELTGYIFMYVIIACVCLWNLHWHSACRIVERPWSDIHSLAERLYSKTYLCTLGAPVCAKSLHAMIPLDMLHPVKTYTTKPIIIHALSWF